MDCSKEINDIFNKWRLQLFSVSFENPATEQRQKINQDGQFNCDKCLAKFKNLKTVKNHIKYVHIKPYKCTACTYSCGTNFELKRHVACKHKDIGSKDKPEGTKYKCDMCMKEFSMLTLRNAHTRRVHNKEKANPEGIIYKCDVCMKEFNNLTRCNVHKRRVHTKPYKCQECKSQFGSSFELKKHINEKHLGLAVKCNICDKVLANEKTFKTHMEVHSSESHYCKDCEYTTRSIVRMKIHTQKSHSGIHFQCTLCTIRFQSKRRLVRHIMIKHEKNVKKFKCELCDFESHYKISMQHHKAGVHEGQRITCDECQQSFSVTTTLRKHKQVHHSNKIIECEDCNFITKTSSSLRHHKEAEHEGIRYKCTSCPMETRYKEYLNAHMKQVHTDPEVHICYQCDYKTTIRKYLSTHLKIHGEKLVCEKCPYETTFKSLLKSHTEVEHLGLGHACNICGVRKTRKCYLEQHMKSKHKEELQ